MRTLFTKLFFISILLGVTIARAADTTSSAATDCYSKYHAVFKERGANSVDDGWHNHVIICIRSGETSECYDGKVEVKYGSVVGFWLKLEDGKYEMLEKKFKTGVEAYVENGISRTRTTLDGEQVNAIFVDKIKPKKKAYVKASDALIK
jgi:hypothetical protein